ncbi:hypothetical protein J4459_02470 [Candidatus Woesearchaeota archaeon]|nr:hypothetical protein [Candidatus Woesearchaeota archaeon]
MDLEKNKKSRLWYVEYWVDYMKRTDSKEWSRQQNIIINSSIQNTRQFKFSPEFYLKTKKEDYKNKRK